MKLTILGTGSFYVTTKRSGPAYLLEADGKKILVDCGPGTLMRLSQIGVSPEEIDYVFISHFHPDHTGDLFAFQMNFRLNEFFGDHKIKKFPIIYGPSGIETFTKKLSKVCQLPAFDNYSKIKYQAYEKPIQIGKIIVKPFRVKHIPFGLSAKAYSLRFEFGGKVIAYSGDSIKHVGLEKVSKKADLFVCDCSYAKGKSSPAHMDTHQIGEIAEKAKPKKVVLTHFYPNLEKLDLVSEVKEKFDGEVVMGKDMMEVEV